MSGTDLTLTTSDGVRIVYDDEGNGSPIVLVHGYDGLRAHWEYQRDVLLSAGSRVIALDLRCHGASDKPEHGQRMARLGQDLRELFELLDLNDVTRRPLDGRFGVSGYVRDLRDRAGRSFRRHRSVSEDRQ